ncbi:S1 RNA-binding domain-containing protein, partial [Bacteroidia bacterium]|nr:S1 RNA-binding domain-containing protein [Bacteroidia bacterium]MDA9110958.1 S1 RNA-binding domain-containing protein [Bacteroidia bacterium]
INEVYKNVVISHKAIIEDDIEAQKAEMISKLEVGQVLEGMVKNMTSFGVFVDLGGLDGLLHITDISWGRINHPEDVLELDQKIQVAVLEFDNEKKRISLGMKQLTAHPWDSMKALEAGEKVKGKVVTVADYGAFVEIEAGVEGLIHVSEMSWSQHLRNPSDFIKVGDEVDAVVLDIDKEEHKLSLGLKQLTSDPWQSIEEKYPVDSKHTGIVRNLTNYGLFVELEEGVDGLVHVSDLSWSKKIKHPAEFTKKGENLEVVVLEIDRDNRRLSLGHKQIDENPWDTFATVFRLGSDHEGVISEINDRGVIFTLPYGVEGFAPKKHTKKEDGTEVKMDETLNVRVIEFNKDAKRILVSHTDIWKEVERAQRSEQDASNKRRSANTNKYVEKMNKSVERSTLGELDVLANLKAKMESAPAAEPKKKAKKAAPKAETKTESAEAPAEDYSAMTVAQLKAAAKKKGIKGYTSLKKAELIEALSK